MSKKKKTTTQKILETIIIIIITSIFIFVITSSRRPPRESNPRKHCHDIQRVMAGAIEMASMDNYPIKEETEFNKSFLQEMVKKKYLKQMIESPYQECDYICQLPDTSSMYCIYHGSPFNDKGANNNDGTKEKGKSFSKKDNIGILISSIIGLINLIAIIVIWIP